MSAQSWAVCTRVDGVSAEKGLVLRELSCRTRSPVYHLVDQTNFVWIFGSAGQGRGWHTARLPLMVERKRRTKYLPTPGFPPLCKEKWKMSLLRFSGHLVVDPEMLHALRKYRKSRANKAVNYGHVQDTIHQGFGKG